MKCPVCKGTGGAAGATCRACGGSGMLAAASGGGGVLAAAPGGTGGGAANAEDELHTARQLLVFTLRYSRVFPPEATEAWIEALGGLDVEAPEAGRAALGELREDYEWAKRRHAPDGEAGPGRTDADLAALFARETGEIEKHLALIEELLALAAAAPGGEAG